MMTAAEEAELFYKTISHPTDDETSIENARKIDKKLINAWVGHP